MKGIIPFLMRRFWQLLLIIIGIVLIIVAIEALKGVPGFTTFFIGAAALIVGILSIIY